MSYFKEINCTGDEFLAETIGIKDICNISGKYLNKKHVLFQWRFTSSKTQFFSE